GRESSGAAPASRRVRSSRMAARRASMPMASGEGSVIASDAGTPGCGRLKMQPRDRVDIRRGEALALGDLGLGRHRRRKLRRIGQRTASVARPAAAEQQYAETIVAHYKISVEIDAAPEGGLRFFRPPGGVSGQP